MKLALQEGFLHLCQSPWYALGSLLRTRFMVRIPKMKKMKMTVPKRLESATLHEWLMITCPQFSALEITLHRDYEIDDVTTKGCVSKSLSALFSIVGINSTLVETI